MYYLLNLYASLYVRMYICSFQAYKNNVYYPAYQFIILGLGTDEALLKGSQEYNSEYVYVYNCNCSPQLILYDCFTYLFQSNLSFTLIVLYTFTCKTS